MSAAGSRADAASARGIARLGPPLVLDTAVEMANPKSLRGRPSPRAGRLADNPPSRLTAVPIFEVNS